jgi:ribosome-binding protein aMBF1 (putative translation factor)
MAMKRKKRKTKSALEIMRRRYFRAKPRRLAELAQARVDDDVARKVRTLREKAGLTQKQLAGRVGTTASVISRLEAADYNGHSLAMLRRIAAAADHRVVVQFVPGAELQRA